MDRRNYNKCGETDFDAFINNIGHSGKFALRAHNPADKNVMQDRYTFAYNGMRISVVYETKSQTLIVTAPAESFDELERNLPASIKPKPSGNAVAQSKPQGNAAGNKGNAQAQPNSPAQSKTQGNAAGKPHEEVGAKQTKVQPQSQNKQPHEVSGQKPQGNATGNKGNAQAQPNSPAQSKTQGNAQTKGQSNLPTTKQHGNLPAITKEEAKQQPQKPPQPQTTSKQPQKSQPKPHEESGQKQQPQSTKQTKPHEEAKQQPQKPPQPQSTKQSKPYEEAKQQPQKSQSKPHEEAKQQPQKSQSKPHEEAKQQPQKPPQPQTSSKQPQKSQPKPHEENAQKQPKSQPQSSSKQSQSSTKQSKSHEVRQGKAAAFEIKNVTSEKLEELLKKIRAAKMRYKTTKDHGGKKFKITAQNQNAELEFNGGSLSLYGDKGNLLSELQLMISQVSDYKTAINSHIKSVKEDRRAGEVERQLKKKLPAAFEFLSEQSKIDLAIAIIDINNSAVVLSDYSTLLIPCFRGLERMIFDLQHAQGIVVKMIGQAYEKEDGNYVLKSGYRRKIPSVVYAEVMASLYTEYFKQRNFYAHSDGGYDNLSRVITDKQQVISIFNHILDVINYNGKKLKEIGFRIV